jgi:hypothetical protein
MSPSEKQAEIDRLISSAVRGAREYDRDRARKSNAFKLTSFTVVLLSAFYIWFELEAFSLMPEIRRNRLRIAQMTRIQAEDIKSVQDFFNAHGKEPVVISGALASHPWMLNNMTFGDIAKGACGESLIDSVVYEASSSQWSGLTSSVFYKIGPYIDKYITGSSDDRGREEKRYAYTNTFGGLPATCPLLQHSCLAPKIGSKPIPGQHDASQPTIFIGPAGTRTELHVDLFLLPFWLSTYIGHKVFRVILFQESIRHFDKSFLSSNRYSKDINIVSGDNTAEKVKRQPLQIFDPDLAIFPELTKVTIFEGHTFAGDVIYMPPGALHGILNVESSFSITPNDLYPPLVKDYLEICRQAGFRNGCLQYLSQAFPGCQYDDDNQKKQKWNQYTKCVLSSEALKGLNRDYTYDRGFSDKLLHKLHGFDSYEEWCISSCNSLSDMSRSLEEVQKNDEQGQLSDVEKEEQKSFLQILDYQHGACKRQCDPL